MNKPRNLPDGSDRREVRATPRIRIVFGDGMRIGPGKADLLEAIGRTGSISAAGRELGMSYRRAWLLVDSLNQMFTQPVVTANAGGAHGGGAGLTPFGADMLAAYRRVEARMRDVVEEEFGRFEAEVVVDGA
ncbi:winged helix-turn-helix domain-containing protein [Chthonobacter albigriseus]|uniref:winged helix-turn-helix domain-containing protein n=1 Tax=Chthonobacter albigriseus TaxID=1683161 RepID=UPI0015EED600|nr:LysR family transcriptional regulator [Chthonobacter albigriseus]